jgi:hypothetical protein
MRFLLTYLFISTTAFGQVESIENCLLPVKLSYDSISLSFNGKQSIATYSIGTNTVEYYSGQQDKWLSFIVPVNFDPLSTVHYIHKFDSVGNPEIVLAGNTKFQNQYKQKVMLIFNIDSIPIQIFNVCYGYSNQDETCVYEKKIELKSDTIKILDFRKDVCFDSIPLKIVSTGVYNYNNGQIKSQTK